MKIIMYMNSQKSNYVKKGAKNEILYNCIHLQFY